VEYLIRLTNRALRDMELIYEFIDAETSDKAFAWFNELAEAIYSLEKLPQRGAVASENKKLRQVFFGKKPNVYRIIYAIDRQPSGNKRIAHPTRFTHITARQTGE
jgi:toxin ParE1/3/4